MIKSSIATVALLIAAATTLALIIPVRAQGLSLSIDPPLVESLIKPGKSIVIAYSVGNQGDPIILTPKITSMKAKGIEGAIELDPAVTGPIRFNLENSDVSLNQSFFLKTKDKKQLLLKIRVPEGTPEGDYYYTFSVRSDPGALFQDQTSSKSEMEIGANILISVSRSGNTQISGVILKFDTNPRFTFRLFGRDYNIIDSSDSVPVDLIIHNTGTNYFKPLGSITLEGPLGEKSEYTIIPQNVIRDSSRLMIATPSAQINCDTNSHVSLCDKAHSIVLSGLFIGPYSLKAALQNTPTQPAMLGRTSFIGIPIKFFIAAGTALSIFMIILRKIQQEETSDKESSNSL